MRGTILKKTFLVLCFSIFCLFCSTLAVRAEVISYEGSNIGYQEYSRWSSPVYSYLVPQNDGTLMRVQSGRYIDGILVEYYNRNFHLESSRIIEEELSIFGGFYAANDNYYILSGQMNQEESSEAEVFRITKYDLDWNRITSVGVSECNTTVPFDAGSARMTMSGKYLIIHTSHEMYASSDGLNHQSNCSLIVDTEDMTARYLNFAYTSHSFNQFVQTDGDTLLTVDHGDAYPRAITLRKYAFDSVAGTVSGSSDGVAVMTFPGEIGNNTTGASIGGFQYSDTSYLMSGNSVIQDEENVTRKTRNIFVASVNKASDEVSLQWLTDYEEGEESASTPQLVKFESNRFLLMWTRGGYLYYVELDGDGTVASDIYKMKGELSDCVPVIYNGNITWYTWDDDAIVYYQISVDNLVHNTVKQTNNGHDFVLNSVADGVANLSCSVCNETKQMRVMNRFSIKWNKNGGDSETDLSNFADQKVGDEVRFYLNSYSSDASLEYGDINSELEVLSSNEDIISVGKDETDYILNMLQTGTSTITIRAKWNPEVSKVFTITVADHDHEYAYIDTTDGFANFECNICEYRKTIAVATSFYPFWHTTGSDKYYSSISRTQYVASEILVWMPSDYISSSSESQDYNKEFEIISSDETVIQIEEVSSDESRLNLLKAGTAIITIRLKYNPEVSRSYTFTVCAIPVIDKISVTPSGLQEFGSAVEISAEASGGKKALQYEFTVTDSDNNTKIIQESSENAVCSWNPDAAGTYTVGVNITDGTMTDSQTVDNYTITKGDVVFQGMDNPLANESLYYGQKIADININPEQLSFVNSTGEKINGIFALDSSEMIPEVGTVEIPWTFTPDNKNYNVCKGTWSIEIKKDVLQGSISKITDRDYDPTVVLGDITIMGEKVTAIHGDEETVIEGSWNWKNPEMIPEAGEKTYQAVFVPDNEEHYNRLEVEVPINIRQAVPEISEKPLAGTITYGENLSNSVLSGGIVSYGNQVIEGSFRWKNLELVPTVADSASTNYEIVFIPQDNVNYESVETNISLVVNRAEPSEYPADKIEVDNNIKKLSEIFLPEGWLWSESEDTLLKAGQKITVNAEYFDQDNYKNTLVVVEISRAACDYENAEIVVDKEASCVRSGIGHTICPLCGDILEENVVIESLGHNMEKVEKAEATCTENGIKEHWVCHRCGKVFWDEEGKNETNFNVLAIKATGHKYQNGICVLCGKEYDTGNAGGQTGEEGTQPTTPIEESSSANKGTPSVVIKTARMSLSGFSNKIAAGKKVQLTVSFTPSNVSNKNVIWTSSNPKIATVNQNGVVAFKKKSAGKSVIITATATDGSGAKAVFKLKSMKGVVKKVSISGAKKRMVKAGKALKLKAKVAATKGANKKLQWTSSNTEYAIVSASGKVKTKKAGKGKTVKITAMATDGSGKKQVVKIKIK